MTEANNVVIAEKHLALLRWVAKRMQRPGEPFADLMQAGALGLMHAARNYRYAEEGRFSTYAVACIRGAIKSWRHDEAAFRCLQAGSQVVSPKLRAMKTYVLLFSELGSDFVRGKARPMALVQPTTCERIEQAEETGWIWDAIRQLSDRSQKILTLRWGLDAKGTRSLDEVAKIVRVTRERIRQIEARALRDLKACHEYDLKSRKRIGNVTIFSASGQRR